MGSDKKPCTNTWCRNGKNTRRPISQAESILGPPGDRYVVIGECETCKGKGYVKERGK